MGFGGSEVWGLVNIMDLRSGEVEYHGLRGLISWCGVVSRGVRTWDRCCCLHGNRVSALEGIQGMPIRGSPH